ncbi:unnamed protein product [Phytophthora fragariaefolia]|uniref:Unnamed protein product n=1 Tax=Phytophthora fragariaefolia TaxID=1490495 RepID=A0A9W6TNZ8_9STRA|nr:unnamed protein product [Phytophthora fragariaefolia]
MARQIRKPQRVFSVPVYAEARVDQVVLKYITELSNSIALGTLSARAEADEWDNTKMAIAVGILRPKREAKRG